MRRSGEKILLESSKEIASSRLVRLGRLLSDVLPSCPAGKPLLPISHQPRQNQADGGTARIKVKSTQLTTPIQVGAPPFMGM